MWSLAIFGELLKGAEGDIPVCFAKWSPNGDYILVGSFDGTWKLLNAKTGTPTRVYKGHQFNDYCIFASFSLTSGTWIISGSADKTVCIWDLNSRHLLQQLEGHEDVVVAVSAHPTTDIIASGALDKDKTVRLWKPHHEDSETHCSANSASADHSEEAEDDI